jgi:low affinity Fe/Cu permease
VTQEKDMQITKETSRFLKFAKTIARASGRPVTFVLAIGVILAWAISGPFFGYSDTWQLVINTGTTIITFLMVFLIQNTQNRDAEAVQVKLDELIRVTEGAHNRLMNLEEIGEKEFERIRDQYLRLAESATAKLSNGEEDTDTPKV